MSANAWRSPRRAAPAPQEALVDGAAMDLISRRAALAGAAATLGAALAPAAAGAAGAAARRQRVSLVPAHAANIRRRAGTMLGRRSSRRGRSRRARDLAALRAAGLDFLRLPVDPGPFLAAAPAQRRALLRSTERGRAAHAAPQGLNVVVNVQANAGTHYWTPARMTGATDGAGVPRLSRARRRDRRAAAAFAAPRWSRSTNPSAPAPRAETAQVREALLARARRARAGADAGRLRRLRQPHPGARRFRSRRRSRVSRRCSTRSTSTSLICSRIRARRGWASGSITR